MSDWQLIAWFKRVRNWWLDWRFLRAVDSFDRECDKHDDGDQWRRRAYMELSELSGVDRLEASARWDAENNKEEGPKP